jgi:hypothetical protein
VRWLHLGLGEGEWRDAGKFTAFFVRSCHPRTAKQSPTIPIRTFCMWQDGTLKHPSGRVFQASLAVKANEIDRQKKRTEKRSSSTKVRYREFHRLLEEIEGVNAERNTHEEGNEKARKFMERELDCTRSTEETDQRLVGI